MIRFFAYHLQNKKEPVINDQPEHLFNSDDLRCTCSGQVLMDDDKAIPLPQIIAQESLSTTSWDAKTIRQNVRDQVIGKRRYCELNSRIIDQGIEDQGLYYEKVWFFTEPGIAVCGIYIRPNKSQGKLETSLVLLPQGTCAFEHADTLTRLAPLWVGGKAIFVFDPRGTGALNCDWLNENQTKSISGRWFKYAYDAWMLGDHLACMWAFDIVRAIEYLCDRPDMDSSKLKIDCEGELSFAGLLAAVANENVTTFHSSTLPTSYLDLLQSGQYDRRILNEWSIVAGMLAHYDLPALRRAVSCSVDK